MNARKVDPHPTAVSDFWQAFKNVFPVYLICFCLLTVTVLLVSRYLPFGVLLVPGELPGLPVSFSLLIGNFSFFVFLPLIVVINLISDFVSAGLIQIAFWGHNEGSWFRVGIRKHAAQTMLIGLIYSVGMILQTVLVLPFTLRSLWLAGLFVYLAIGCGLVLISFSWCYLGLLDCGVMDALRRSALTFKEKPIIAAFLAVVIVVAQFLLPLMGWMWSFSSAGIIGDTWGGLVNARLGLFGLVYVVGASVLGSIFVAFSAHLVHVSEVQRELTTLEGADTEV